MDQDSQILIVASDQVFLEGARHALASAGYSVQCAQSGQQALDLAAQHPFDLALVDEDLADISVSAVCRQIKAAQPACLVLLVGGTGQESVSQSAEVPPGVDGFILRPASGGELLAQLRPYLRIQQTQAALRASENRFHSFVGQASEGILMVDEQGVIVEFNLALEQMTGLQRHQVVGQTAWDFQFHLALETHRTPAFYERIKARWLEAIHTGQSPMLERPVEAVYRRADGSTRIVSQSFFPIQTATGFRIGGIARDVTEQRQAQQALNASEAKYRQLYESMIDGYGCVDMEGHLLDCNQAYLDMLGYTTEELRQLTYFDYTPEKWRDIEAKIVAEQILTRGYSDVYEKEYRRKNGTIFPVELHTALLRDENGQPKAMWAIVRDITARKQAEQALRESEANFRGVFENNTVGLYRTTPDGRILMANPALLHMLGFEDFALLAQRNLEEDYFNMSYPRSEYKRQIESQGQVKGLESAWKKDDGSFVYVLESARGVDDGAGNTLYYEGTVEDITERKKAEQALQIERDRAQQYLDTAEVILTAVNAQSQVTMINQPGCRILGYSAEELMGKDWVDAWVPVRIQEEVRTALNQYMAGKIDTEYHENLVLTKSGKERMVAWHNTLLKDEQGNVSGILAAGMDITERTRAEMALAEERSLLDMLLDNIPDSIYFKDAQSRIIRSNQALARRVRMNDPLQMIGKTDFDFYREDHARAAYEDEQAIIRSGQPLLDKEEKETFQDGRVLWVSSTKMPLRDKQGQIVGTFGISRDITGRKQAEKALDWERYLMRAMMDNIPDAIYFKDLEGRYFLANPAMLGIRPGLKDIEEIYGKTDADFFDPETARTFAELEQAVIHSGNAIVGLEHEEKWPDRPPTWALTTKMPLRDADGSMIGTFGVSSDITRRKQAETDLSASEKRYRSLFENMQEGLSYNQMVYVDGQPQDFIYLATNHAFETLTGLHDVVGKKVSEVIPGIRQSDPELFEIYSRVAQTGKPERFEMFVRALNDWYSVSAFSTESGYFITVFDNITERKKAEALLRESEERFHNLFQNSSLGIFHSTPGGQFLRANPALAHMLGYGSPEELISSVTDIKTQVYANPDRHTQTLSVVTQQDDWLRTENQYRRKDGSLITASLAVRRVLNPDGDMAYLEGFVEDITQRRRVENELHQDEKRLEGLLEISQHETENIEELLSFAVRQAIDLTGSRIGYFFSYDEQTQRLTLNTRDLDAIVECAIPLAQSVYRLDETGLSGEPIRQRKPLVINDFQAPNPLKQGFPEGHVRIDKFLSLPVFFQDRIVGLLAVANKPEDYDQADIRQATLLMNSVWRMVETKKAEERLRFALEAGNDGLWDNDVATGNNYFSPRYYTILGYQPGEFPATQAAFESRVHPDDLARVLQAVDDYYQERTDKYEVEFRMLAKSGEVVWILSRAKAGERDRQGKPLRMVGTHTDITRRKQAEEALAASEQSYRGLMKQASDGIFITDEHGRYVDANQAACDLLGYTREEILQFSMKDLIAPEDEVVLPARLAELHSGKAILSRRNLYRKDRTTVPVEISGKMLEDGRLLGIVRDITERKQAEEAVRASEERFRQIAESTGDFIWEEDASGLFLYASPAVEKILGYTPDELVGKKYWPDLLTPASRPAVMAAFQSAYARKEAFRDTLIEFAHKDGRVVMLESSGLPMLDAQGNLVGYRGADKDVTERNCAEQALQESEDRFRTLFEHAAVGVALIDTKTGRFLRINQKYCDFLGYSMEEMLNFSYQDVTYPDDRQENMDNNGLLMQGKINEFTIEKRYLRKDGAIVWGNLTGSPLWKSGETPEQYIHIAVVQDITQRKHAEEAVRESEARLKEAERMAHLGSSTWDVANDVTIWSDELYRITGWDRATPLPKREQRGQLYTPESWKRVKPALDKAITDAEPYEMELDLLRPDGTLRFVHVRGEAETNENGKVVRLHGSLQDISELRQAQENLRQTHQLLNAIVDASPLGISAIDRHGQLTLWSPACERLFGWTRAEVDSDKLVMVPAELKDEVKQQVREELAGTPRTDLVSPRCCKDGRILDISLSTAPLRDATGNITGSMAIYEDISQRKRAEEALRESEIKFRAIFENSRDAIGVSHAGISVYVNPAYLEVFGYTDSSEVVGHSLFKMVAAEDRQRVAEISAGRTHGRDVPANYETRGLRKDGSQFDIDVKATTYELNGKRYTLAVIRDVTERKHAEEALRRSEERYRMLAENMTDTVWMFDMDLKYTYISPSLVRQRGYTLEEINSVPLDRQVAPETFERAMQAFHEILTPQNLEKNIPLPPVTLELEIYRKDGSSFWSENTYLLVRNKDGKPVGLLGSGRDITERKRTEAERQALLEIMQGVAVTGNLQEFLEQVRQSLAKVIYAENFSVVFHNKNSGLFEEVFSLDMYDLPSPPAKLEKSITSYVFSTGEPLLLDQAKFMELEALGEVELVGSRSSSWLGAPIKTPGGTIGVMTVQHYEDANCYSERDRVFFASVAGQVSLAIERKQTEQALRESEQRFRSFIEQSAEAVTIVDEEGRIIEWNASRERMTGLARQEVIGKYYWDVQFNLALPEYRSQQALQHSKNTVLEAVHTGQSPIFEHAVEGELALPDGERRNIRQTVFPIRSEKGFRIGSISQDITELKQTEALRMARDAAEGANRAKSEFLANMSHELRTPLNAVIGFSDMLSQQYYGPLTGKQGEYVTDIHESATYLLSLINDILDLSKIEAGRMDLETSRVDLHSMIKHSLVMVRERAAKHALYLSSSIDPRLEPLRFMADERKVRQILYNLLANAVKFTPDGGAVDLSARLVDQVEGKGQSWVEISITDTGIGLAPKDLDRVFEAFYQVKSPETGKTPGTGLGLSLVKRMVELHGGKVWAESKGPGWGARFVFTLPLPIEQPGETQ